MFGVFGTTSFSKGVALPDPSPESGDHGRDPGDKSKSGADLSTPIEGVLSSKPGGWSIFPANIVHVRWLVYVCVGAFVDVCSFACTLPYVFACVSIFHKPCVRVFVGFNVRSGFRCDFCVCLSGATSEFMGVRKIFKTQDLYDRTS